jgi:hypothetical protein
LTVRNFAPPTPRQEITVPTGTHLALQDPALHVAPQPLDTPSPGTRDLFNLIVEDLSPAQTHGIPATSVSPAPVPLPTASPTPSGRIRLSALSPTSSQALAARPRSVLPPQPHDVQPAPQRARGGDTVRYPPDPVPRAPREQKQGTRPESPDRRPRTKTKDGRSRSQDKRDTKRAKRSKDDCDPVLHLKDTPPASRSPSPQPSRSPQQEDPRDHPQDRSHRQDRSRSPRGAPRKRGGDTKDDRKSRGDGRDRDAARRS